MAAMLAIAAFVAPATSARAVDRCLAVAEAPPGPPATHLAATRTALIGADGSILRLAALTGLPAAGAWPRPRSDLVQAQMKPEEVQITFWGHSTFVIESPAGVRIATDYNDYIKPAPLPDIVTMNRAHSSHYTDMPEPGIKHVLRGWNPEGGAAQHDVSERDVRVRNVPTNIRTWEGGGHVPYGNSIFVFEVAGLCIAHLGHLHHTLTVQQLGQIGQMDVVLVPVDGSYTLDLPGMVEVLKALRAPLMLPMHYFSSFTLARFLDQVRGTFEIEEVTLPMLTVSRANLPKRQTVRVLPGR